MKRSYKTGGPTYYNVWDTVAPAPDEPYEYFGSRQVKGRTIVDNGSGVLVEYRASFDKQTHTGEAVESAGNKTAAETIIIRKDREGSEVYRHTSSNPDLTQKAIQRAARRIIDEALVDQGPLSAVEKVHTANEYLRGNLSAIYSGLVKSNKNLNEYVHRRGFQYGVDEAEWHSPEWHQWGIVTHSKKFAEALEGQVPSVLKDWGLDSLVQEELAQKIDDVPKNELLQTAALLHDSGKIVAAKIADDNKSIYSQTPKLTFKGHEEESGKIIRDGNIGAILKNQGLTQAQVDYIACCAELHFELGKLRNVVKETGGYNLDFIETQDFQDAAQKILDNNPEYALEIGLMFLADCYSKSEVKAVGATDEAIKAEHPKLEKELAARNLYHKLIRQALQAPVNEMVGVAYLVLWAENKINSTT